MILLGAIANGVFVFIGGILGTILGSRLNTKIEKAVGFISAIWVIYIGLTGILSLHSLLICFLSLLIGAIIGFVLDIDNAIKKFGGMLGNKFTKKNESNKFADGFVSCTLLICVGSMAVIGSLQSGTTNNQTTLLTKTVIDSFSAVIMASQFGVGVSLAGITVFIYEGSLTLFASHVASFLTTAMINDMTAVGSVIICLIGFNMLKITETKVANFILATFIPILLYLVI